MKTDMYVQTALGEAKQSFGALSSLGLKERRHHLCRSRISLWKGNLEWRLIWGKPWHATRVEKVADFKAYCSLFFSHAHTYVYIYTELYILTWSYWCDLVASNDHDMFQEADFLHVLCTALTSHCRAKSWWLMVSGGFSDGCPFFDPFGQV